MNELNLNEGDKAPSFTGVDELGREIKLSDFKGKKLILFFYPLDHTSGCTAEVCNLRDNYSLLRNSGYELIGVSINGKASHRRFKRKFNLPFSLIADGKEIMKRYGVWRKRKFLGIPFHWVARTTFVINEQGLIEQVISNVNVKDHAKQILEKK